MAKASLEGLNCLREDSPETGTILSFQILRRPYRAQRQFLTFPRIACSSAVADEHFIRG